MERRKGGCEREESKAKIEATKIGLRRSVKKLRFRLRLRLRLRLMGLERSVTNDVKVEAAYGVGRFDVDIQIITGLFFCQGSVCLACLSGSTPVALA